MNKSPKSFKDTGRGISTDMSPEAISKRIRMLDDLWKTARRLQKEGASLTKG